MYHKAIITFACAGAAVALLVTWYRYYDDKEEKAIQVTSIADRRVREVWKDGTRVLNPWHFTSTIPDVPGEQRLVASLLCQIYSAPLTEQEALAQKLALENKSKAHFMWYEAFVTGHKVVASAFVKGGEVVMQGSDLARDFEVSVQSYLDSVKDDIWQAERDQKKQLVLNFIDEHPDDRSDLMFSAAVKGQTEVIRILIDKQVPFHQENQSWLVPLQAACFNGNLESAQALLAGGVAIDHQDEFGGTPLMRAATGGHIEIVQWLLENGADINLQDASGQNMNALVHAVWHGKKEIAQLLIQRGSNFTSHLLAAAAYGGDPETYYSVLRLCDLPASVTSTWKGEQLTQDQRKMFLIALEYSGNGAAPTIIRDLLDHLLPLHGENTIEKFDDLAIITEALFISLQKAAKRESVETVDFILQFVSRYLVGESNGQITDATLRYEINSLLTRCAEEGSAKVAKYLMEKHNADVNARRLPHHTSPLFHAARSGHVELIDLLVTDHDADIHQGSGRFANGPTALWEAVAAGQEWAARRLLELGGPVEAIDKGLNSSSTHVYVSASKTYRGPVVLNADISYTWLAQGSQVHFLCLEYPDGVPFLEKLQFRKSDEDLKDNRELRASP